MNENMQKALAVIPARGGSKGIPRKNIVPLAGKPLIVWSIEAAKASRNIGRIIVTSDDDEILKVASNHGVEILKRPAEFSTDTARAEQVMAHALKFARQKGQLPEWAVYLQPTAPLRRAEHIDRAFDLLMEKRGDALVSVTEADRKLLKALLITTAEGHLITAARKDYRTLNRQELPPTYVSNGAVYILRSNEFLRRPRFHGRMTIPFFMEYEDSVDIDTMEDLMIVEKLLASRK